MNQGEPQWLHLNEQPLGMNRHPPRYAPNVSLFFLFRAVGHDQVSFARRPRI
jgi:hypothetical protein